MSSQTLLLSRGYEPIATIPWQKAITLLFQGKIEIVAEYDDREIRSVSVIFKMPAVVRLLHALRKKKKSVKFSRQNVLARDRWKCCYCGEKKMISDLTYDHVVPRAKGGKTEWENIVTSCYECNHKKADMTLAQAGMRLKYKPSRPTWVPIFTLQLSGPVPDQWASFLYWNTELS